MYSFLLNKDITEKTVHPCYLFYGEEPFLAYEFLDILRKSLVTPEEEGFPVEKMDLEEDSWADVIDLARTIPFFFTAYRLIAAEIPKAKAQRLSNTEKSILKAYLESPTERTVLVLIVPEKMKKGFALSKCLSGLPSSKVRVKEIKPLTLKPLLSWMDRKLKAAGKTASPDARRRLVEMTGSDLALLSRELEKIVTFVGDKKVIELDDVNQVSGLVKSFVEWELTNSLEKRDYHESVVVLKKLLQGENQKPEYIMGTMAKLFREVLTAKLLLRQRKDRAEIFKALRPQIQPHFPFYRESFNLFFSLVDKMTLTRLNLVLSRLEDIDLKIKTSDLSPQVMIEGFLYDYCLGKGDDSIWRTME